MRNSECLRSHAKHFAEKFHWAIIPVRGKEAACRWKRYLVTAPGRRQLGGLFSIAGVTGLAVVVGSVSDGLRVRDFDNVDSYHEWKAAHPELAISLPTSQTHRGYHVFFRANGPGRTTMFEDGELRAGRGYVVLPPSVHPDGGVYRWIIQPGESIPLIEDVDSSGLSVPLPTLGEASSIPTDVDEAITKTLPAGVGKRTNCIWQFARRLKAIEGLDDSDAALRSYAREWHRRAIHFIRSKSFDVTELAFYDAWKNAKVPLSDEQFHILAKPFLEGPDPEWLKKMVFPLAGKRLWRLCLGLQERAGPEPFFLAARAAASVIGTDPTLVSRLFKRLVTAGHLEEVEKGVHRSGRATTWRYLGPSFSTEPVVLAPELAPVEQAVAV